MNIGHHRLQRYPMKWAGDHEPRNGQCWRAFRELFLMLYRCRIPAEYRLAEWDDIWRLHFREHANLHAQVVREIHETTVYVNSES